MESDINDFCQTKPPPVCTENEKDNYIKNYIRRTSAHELAHQFRINSNLPCEDDHDNNVAWCDANNHCNKSNGLAENCVMNSSRTLIDRADGTIRFDIQNLLDGELNQCNIACSQPPQNFVPGDGAIRIWKEPND